MSKKNNQNLIKLSALGAITASILLPSHHTFAQFSKYKTKTKYSQEEGYEDRELPLKNELNKLDDLTDADQDQFGRKAPEKKIKVNNKFVNLNPETAFGQRLLKTLTLKMFLLLT